MQIHRDDFCSRTIRPPSPHTWRIWRLSLFFVLTNQKTLEAHKGARSNKFETSSTAMHQTSSVIKFGGTFAEVCKALVEQDLPLVVQMAEFQTFVTAVVPGENQLTYANLKRPRSPLALAMCPQSMKSELSSSELSGIARRCRPYSDSDSDELQTMIGISGSASGSRCQRRCKIDHSCNVVRRRCLERNCKTACAIARRFATNHLPSKTIYP